MISPPSTVIFVHSTAHWEAIQKQRAQLLGVPPAPQAAEPKRVVKKPATTDEKIKRSHVGSANSRRRKRWANSMDMAINDLIRPF